MTSKDKKLLMTIRKELNDRSLTPNGGRISVSIDHGDVLLFGLIENEQERNRIAEKLGHIDGVKNIEFKGGQMMPGNFGHDRQMHKSMPKENKNQSSSKQSYYAPAMHNQVSMNENRQQQYNSNSNQEQYSPNEANTYSGNKFGTRQQMQRRGQVSDESLRQKIKDKLTNAKYSKSYGNLDIQVSNHTVTVTGYVDTQGDRQDVENRVKSTPGVKNVNLYIMVKNPKSGTQRSLDQMNGRSYKNY